MKCAYTQTMFQFLVPILSFVSLTKQSSSCPPNAYDRITQCTDSVLPDLNKQQGSTDRYQIENAKDTCRDSRLPEVADCIQNILDMCRGTTDEEQTLQRLIDKEKVVKTVDYFCRHIRVYEENVECIAKFHEETSNCSQEAHKNFKAKYAAGANMDVLITGSCRFHSVARGCLTNTTHRRCGSTASNFVYTLLTGLMPPFCETMDPEYTNVHTTRSFYTEKNQNVYSSAIYLHPLFSLNFVNFFIFTFMHSFT